MRLRDIRDDMRCRCCLSRSPEVQIIMMRSKLGLPRSSLGRCRHPRAFAHVKIAEEIAVTPSKERVIERVTLPAALSSKV